MTLELYNYMWGPSEFKANGTLKNFDLSDELFKLDLPVLITCGRFDEAHPKSMAKFNKLIILSVECVGLFLVNKSSR